MRVRVWLLVLMCVAPAGAFAQSSPAPSAPGVGGSGLAACSTLSQNLTVRDLLDDVYLWYRELPTLDPARFDSPEAYLEAVRFRRFDASFSYISSKAADDAFFARSQFVGFGFSTKVVEGQLVVTEVFPQGPAAEAGWVRGVELRQVDGVPAERLLGAGALEAALGPRDVGVSARFEWVSPQDGTTRSTVLAKRVVTIPTVALHTVLTVADKRVGYLVLRNFVDTTPAALDEVFKDFERAGLDELVVDVRYNGGGFVSVAQQLAGMIGGARTAHQVFATLTHSERLRSRDRVLRFPTPDHALRLSRLIVITSRASASASELLINALRPHMPVVTIGERTLGKPVGQYSLGFCDKVLHPVAFDVRNARGEGGFFDGIPADCPAADDVRHALGSPEEASLAVAFYYVRTGVCPVQVRPPQFASGTIASTPAPSAAWSVRVPVPDSVWTNPAEDSSGVMEVGLPALAASHERGQTSRGGGWQILVNAF